MTSPRSLTAWRRTARHLPSLLVLALVLGVGVMALAHPGVRTTEVDVDDGGVWVTNEAKQMVGHLNYDSRTLDAALRAGTMDFDIGQAGETVTFSDLTAHSVAPVQVAEAALGAATSLPGRTLAVQGGDRVGLLDPDEGSLWVVDAHSPAAALTESSALSTGLRRGAVSAAQDGTVVAASAAAGLMVTVAPTGSLDSVRTTRLTGLAQGASLSLTVVGDRPVGLDADSGTLVLPDGSVRDLSAQGVGTGAVLQAPGPASDSVLVSTGSALLSVPLDGGEVTTTPATADGRTGAPAPPVRHQGCAYAAWAGSGAYQRVCDDPGASTAMVVDTLMAASNQLVFRTNRTRIVLNDISSGSVWLPEENMVLMDDWDEVEKQLAEKEDQEDSPEQTDQIADPHRNEQNTPPDAVDDSFGVRPGRTTTLPVLQNDSDADGDVLTATATTTPSLGSVAATRGGRALQVTDVEEDATGSTTFTYEASDGQAADTATVTVTVHPWSDNEGPTQLRDPSLRLGAGAQTDYNVLADWIDPDGDQVYLSSATAPEGTEVRYTEEGTVSVRDLGGGPGPREVTVVVSDGRASTTGTLTVDVQDAGNVPPTANADLYVARVGEPLTLEPLANDTDANGDPLSLVSLSVAPAGTTLTPDLALGTVSLTATAPGTHQITYTVTDGPSTALGVIRVDVVPVDEQAVPVAEDDLAVLPAGGSSLVAPLGNDSDPSGGVLVIQSVEAPGDGRLEVTLVDRHLLRVSAPSGLDAPASLRYSVSNGQATATAYVTVVPAPARDDKRPPQLQADWAKVQVGDVGSVNVLANDTSPAGLPLSVDPDLVYTPSPVGTPFVTGNLVRLEAGTSPGTLQVAYSVHDSSGNLATSTVTFEVIASDQANNAPQPQALTAWAVTGETTRIPVPLNGTDPDGDSVSLVGVAQSPTKGTVELGTGWLEYTPARDTTGTDVFTYTVEDSRGKQASARVRVGIAPPSQVNQDPVAQDDVVRARPGRRLSVPVTANDIDADGDPVALVPGSLESPVLAATTTGNYVSVTTPAAEGSYLVSYGISDGRGGGGRGTLTVNVSADAPLAAPVARDDNVLLSELPEHGQVRIDVLANDEDPDGDRSSLSVTAHGEGVAVDGSSLLITPGARRRLVVYTVTDADGLSASALVSVPGADRSAPVLDATRLPVRVRSGQDVTLDVRDYVLVRPGRSARVTDASTLGASVGVDPGIRLSDEYHVTFRVAADYYGKTSVSFTARDGAAEDDSATSASLTLPLEVESTRNNPPTLRPTLIRVAAGEDAVTQDLSLMVDDPEGADPAGFAYQVSDVPAGVSASLSGHTLSVRADAGQAKGPLGSLTVSVDDGSGAVTAQVPVTLVASTRALTQVSDAVITAARSGGTEAVDLTQYTINPFPGTPLRVVGSSVQVGQGTVDPQGTTLNITPATGFRGQMTVTYRLMDATGDADRVVEGRVRLVVRDRPEAPTNVRVSAAGAGHAFVTFDPGADNGAPITGFTVTDAATGEDYTCTVASCELTGLSNGVRHSFTVVAHNDVGDSPASAASPAVLIDTAPAAPAAPVVVPSGSGRVTVTWQEPANEGSAITGYTVSLAGGQTREVGGAERSVTFDGLTNGRTYSVTVTAHNNAEQPSGPSPATQVVPYGPPDAPVVTDVTSTGGAGDHALVHVAWTLGRDNGRAFTTATVAVGTVSTTVPATDGSVDLSVPVADTQARVTVQVCTQAGDCATSPERWVHVVGAPPVPDGTLGVAPTGSYGTLKVSGVSRAAGGGYGLSSLFLEYCVDGGSWRDLPDDGVVNVGTNAPVSLSVRQRGVNAQGVTAYSTVLGPVTASAQSAPSQPDISVTKVTSTSVQFSWSVPEASSPAATASVAVDGQSVATNQAETGAYTATGLEPGKDHVITLTLTNSLGSQQASTTTTTLPALTLAPETCQGDEAGAGADCRTYSVTPSSWPTSLGQMTCTFSTDLPGVPPVSATLRDATRRRSGIAVTYTSQDELTEHADELVSCTG
ncbi:Ig-like domain-containing protein [Actinomyces sp. oral taxon 897]|uniref:Ig-like domain-containing protein n=1 Tax=Actinomyces sp. oral taxon 897 TaxID=2081702 RepID=UPI0020C24EE0|nr:Ig-like domain-containing protein [Actinomyces sp. oral taxon 897]